MVLLFHFFRVRNFFWKIENEKKACCYEGFANINALIYSMIDSLWQGLRHKYILYNVYTISLKWKIRVFELVESVTTDDFCLFSRQ